MTNVHDRIDDNVNAALLCNLNCVFQLVFSPPASRNSALLVKLAEIPLKAVRT